MKHPLFALLLLAALPAWGQTPAMPPEVAKFIRVNAPVVALTHVRVVDGTGAPARDDQTIVLSGSKIQAVGDAASTAIPKGAQVLDLAGYTVLPGLVGMHNHLYDSAWLNRDPSTGRLLPPGFIVAEIPYTAPRLYLAAGVTTMRTTGDVDGYTDLEVKRQIEAGEMVGPAIDATAPYLEGPGSIFPQMHQLTGPDDARRLVDYWADEGATSYKAYMNITRDDLAAAIQEAHQRGFKLTGHLCSVTWPEAIARGIDDFEHGPVFTDTEFAAGKQPDKCPSGPAGPAAWAKLDVSGPEVQGLIRDLVSHHVAVTSTLPVFDASNINHPPNPRALEAMAPSQLQSFLAARAGVTPEGNARTAALIKKEMEFEHAFAQAGGLLLAGPDPTGNGGTIPGFGDWRELELLVEAGFTPLEAIKIASYNGAQYLGRLQQIGSIAAGKQADLVVVHGDPASKIEDIEKTEIVFKKGVGYDSLKLIESVRGQVGVH
ncbi:MAG TPA: amidohydrolase family protein [Terriglobales bacterium]|jgi:imidazolonepropionase-like amidohydrolase|nr:amidohydrolase family protein [Terriglobales bacterium]